MVPLVPTVFLAVTFFTNLEIIATLRCQFGSVSSAPSLRRFKQWFQLGGKHLGLVTTPHLDDP